MSETGDENAGTEVIALTDPLSNTTTATYDALNRATTKQSISVATASDASHLYVWKTDGK